MLRKPLHYLCTTLQQWHDPLPPSHFTYFVLLKLERLLQVLECWFLQWLVGLFYPGKLTRVTLTD